MEGVERVVAADIRVIVGAGAANTASAVKFAGAGQKYRV
jgi:dihydrodipicolinate synthase/N-acetylneuraminate lyase